MYNTKINTYDGHSIRVDHFFGRQQRKIANIGERVDKDHYNETDPNGSGQRPNRFQFNNKHLK